MWVLGLMTESQAELTFWPKFRKAHIDIDPSSINKVIDVDIPIIGDVECVSKIFLNFGNREDKRQTLQQSMVGETD